MGAKKAVRKANATRVAALTRENRILRGQLEFLAELAGVAPELSQIRRRADLANPASPVPDPPEEAAPQSTEDTLRPDTEGDASRPGAEAGSLDRVPAEQTTTSLTPGVEIQTPPASNLISVTAPVQGTNPAQDGGVPIEQRRIETDVRIDPDPLKASGPGIGGQGSDGTGFPWVIGARENARTAVRKPAPEDAMALRTMASLRLARLRVQAGLARGDDLSLGQEIASSRMPTPAIEHEISVLNKVATARPAPQQRTMARQASRPVPSLAPSLAPAYASVSAGGDLDDCSDIFE
jgi:hypothetical protein